MNSAGCWQAGAGGAGGKANYIRCEETWSNTTSASQKYGRFLTYILLAQGL